MRLVVVRHQFGFLDSPVTYNFHGGSICPAAGFEEVRGWIKQRAHQDGFIYPGLVRQQDENGIPIPNTVRPQSMHRLPASHELTLDAPLPEDRERSHASFIVYLVGFLHGTHLRFSDWWFDTRVPLHGTHNIHVFKDVAEHFLSHAFDVWNKWPRDVQVRFVNILFLLNRAPAYTWDWEHFIAEYTIVDGCYRTARNLRLIPKEDGHANRINALLSAFSIPNEATLVKDIVRLRNDLLHETMWDGRQPGTAAATKAFFAPLHLRRLNQRLILGLLGYDNEYLRSTWWHGGSFGFGIP